MMNRQTIRSVFILSVIGIAAFALWQFVTLKNNEQLVGAVSAIPATATLSDEAPKTINHSVHTRLAWANALSAGGELTEAEQIYGELINQNSGGEIALNAEYNLANAYLREGLNTKLSGNRTRALLGLAKQRYRNVLRQNPSDWDVRYNLERALRLAPEVAGLANAKGPPVKSVDVVVPDFMLKALP